MGDPSPQQLGRRAQPGGPAGVGGSTTAGPALPGAPSPAPSKCSPTVLTCNNAVVVLSRSAEFKRVLEEIKSLGVQLKASDKTDLQKSLKPAGTYDVFTNTIELPPQAFALERAAKSLDVLHAVAHEIRHAHQFAPVLRESLKAGGNEAARTRLVDAQMDKWGKDKFVQWSMSTEKEAETFAVRVTLEALGSSHTGYQVYRGMFPKAPSTKDYIAFMIDTWWLTNEDTYRRDAGGQWQAHLKRVNENKTPAKPKAEAGP